MNAVVPSAIVAPESRETAVVVSGSCDTRLRAVVHDAPALSCETRLAMYELYTRYYDGADLGRFESDLIDKHYAILLRDSESRLRGFSTLMTLEIATVEGSPARAIFSGDTIVDHRFWGQQTLAFRWIRLAGQLAAQAPDTALYWLLIVKGHRTYRYLHAFARRYYPHWREPTPRAEQFLIDQIATSRFGPCYRHGSGLIRFPEARDRLKPKWAVIEEADRRRPEVAFFLRRNASFRRGDELVCLTELTTSNLRPLARRLFEQGLAG